VTVAEKSERLHDKDGGKVSAPIVLPTQSWRALLQEQPLSADAKPFVPNQASWPGQSKGTAPCDLNSHAHTSSDKAPHWMQYLSTKFETGGPDLPNRFEQSGGKGKGSKGKSKGKPARAGTSFDTGGGFGNGSNSVAEGLSLGGSPVIHTEAYFKLLKDGLRQKKVPLSSQTARRTQNKSKAGLSADALSMEDRQDIYAEALMPMTAANLAKKWASVVSRPSGLNEYAAVEAELEVRTTQDDIGVEKLLFDQDLSDPAYHSDSEQREESNQCSKASIKTNASMHRLGYRPRATASAIRSYVMQDLNFLLDQKVGMLLLRLQRFMDQQRTFATSERRFVIGLKEVSRRTKQSKVECLIVAPDIEEDANSGGLDDRMRELIASAYGNETPVVFALSRARLGKALGKSLHISVLGVLDSKGARHLLQESLRLATECRQAWLGRLQ